MRMHPDSARLRQLVPPLAVAGIVAWHRRCRRRRRLFGARAGELRRRGRADRSTHGAAAPPGGRAAPARLLDARARERSAQITGGRPSRVSRHTPRHPIGRCSTRVRHPSSQPSHDSFPGRPVRRPHHAENQPGHDMDERHGPRQGPARHPHAVPSGQAPATGVAPDIGSGMEHRHVGEVSDLPAGVDQPPAQLDFLVAVEQLREVAPDRLVGRGPNRRCPTKEERDVARSLGRTAAGTRDVTTSRGSVLVDEAQRHRAECRSAGELLDDPEAKLPEPLSHRRRGSPTIGAEQCDRSQVTSSWHAEILRRDDETNPRIVRNRHSPRRRWTRRSRTRRPPDRRAATARRSPAPAPGHPW